MSSTDTVNAEDTREPVTLVVLGASGDLTSRLLIPGLASLLAVECERRVRLVGVDRHEIGTAHLADTVRAACDAAGVPASCTDPLADSAEFRVVDVTDADQLAGLLDDLAGPLILYFALPPSVTGAVCALLEDLDLPDDTRLALEKPFGHDLDSARALNAQLTRVVPENRVFRVDHFLGLSTVLNILGLRFSNRLLQPLWDAEHIESIHVLYDEDLALEERAGYYDGAGALVDMIQSHLLQVLAVLTMSEPATINARDLRDHKGAMLRATRVRGGDPAASSARARYTAGRLGDRDVPDYVAEDGVDPANETETMARLVVEVENERWSGIPITLQSGKALAEPRKQVVVTFRPVRHLPAGLHGEVTSDRLVLDLKPGVVTLELTMNGERDPFTLEHKALRARLGDSTMLPYGEVLAGILDGDPLLSIRGDIAEECWRIVDPVVAAWRAGEVPMEEYAAGSTGPGWTTPPPPLPPDPLATTHG